MNHIEIGKFLSLSSPLVKSLNGLNPIPDSSGHLEAKPWSFLPFPNSCMASKPWNELVFGATLTTNLWCDPPEFDWDPDHPDCDLEEEDPICP